MPGSKIANEKCGFQRSGPILLLFICDQCSEMLIHILKGYNAFVNLNVRICGLWLVYACIVMLLYNQINITSISNSTYTSYKPNTHKLGRKKRTSSNTVTNKGNTILYFLK